VALPAEILLGLFKNQQQEHSVKRKEIDVPGDRREIIDPRKRRVKEQVTKK
jgi:hypothetical protein